MEIKDILTSGANVNITISANDLRTFLAEVAQEVVNKEKAAEAAKNDVEMLNQAQVCSYLGVSKATVWRWEKIGYLRPSTRMGSRPMYNKTDVERIKKGA
ncbi:MAG: helix-turn-helix domain-containing protein [Prevotella sp.]|nr:helix-turn-helix domain-containing protein [Prevotella sp.]